jgi:hypothetical protein
MNIIFVQFVYHKQYGDITELKKYSVDGGNKAHHLSCKSCGDANSRSAQYCRICTFKGPNFPDIIPIHTNAATHGDCLTKHKEDIRDWGYFPVKPKKAKTSKK